jgi:hypothetical protein
MDRRHSILALAFAALTLAWAGQALADKPVKGGKGKDQQQSQQDHGKDKGGKGHEQGQPDQGGKGKGHGKAKGHKDKSGKNLLGDKVKQNGKHKLEKKGAYTASVDVQNGKVKGMDVQHDTKGAVEVTKYKSKQKMAFNQATGGEPRLMTVQDTYIDTIWIGYAYLDDDGYEEIYWVPVDMVMDGDTGAIWFEEVYY